MIINGNKKDLKIEQILLSIADTQVFADPEDELSLLISKYKECSDELSIEEMEQVSAAVKVDYQEFLSKVRKSKIPVR